MAVDYKTHYKTPSERAVDSIKGGPLPKIGEYWRATERASSNFPMGMIYLVQKVGNRLPSNIDKLVYLSPIDKESGRPGVTASELWFTEHWNADKGGPWFERYNFARCAECGSDAQWDDYLCGSCRG